MLREMGHDVRAADEDRELDGVDDPPLFALAVMERRVFITANVRDFLPILREWAEAGKQHSGCILIASSIRREHFGAIIAGVRRVLNEAPDQDAWSDKTYWLSKHG